MKIRSIVAAALFVLPLACSTPTHDAGLRFEELAVPSFSLTEERRFGTDGEHFLQSATHVRVTSDGLLVVNDWMAGNLKVFRQDGSWVTQIGKKGLGPGEFDGIGTVSVVENDTIVVHDGGLQRVSVFAREGDQWDIRRTFALKTQMDGSFRIMRLHRVKGLYGYFAIEANNPHRDHNTTGRLVHTFRLRFFNAEADPSLQNILEGRYGESLILTSGTGTRFSSLPDGRFSVVRFTDEEIHVAPWNDSLHIVRYSLNGDSLGSFSVNMDERPLSQSDIADDPRYSDPEIAQVIKPTHPAFVDFLVADNGDYWVNMGIWRDKAHVWAVFSPDGELRGSTTVPKSVALQVVKGDVAIGLSRGGEEPAVVMHKIPADIWL